MQSSAVPTCNQTARPSFCYCQEKCACPKPNTLADLYCVNCKSFQCQLCFHITHQKVSHQHCSIPNIPLSILCEGQLCKKTLPSPNFADFVCVDCGNQRFCVVCELAVHKGPLLVHHSHILFADFLKNQHQSDQAAKVDANKIINQEENNLVASDSPSSDSDSESSLEFQSFTSENIAPTVVDDIHSEKFLTSFIQQEESSQGVLQPEFFKSFASYSELAALPDSIDSTKSEQFESSIITTEMNGKNTPIPRARNRQTPSTPLNNVSESTNAKNGRSMDQAVQLMNNSEELMVENCEKLSESLGCGVDQEFFVISIIGNTGDGKSHTLNHTYFNGTEVFQVSDSPNPCTIGIYVAVCGDYLLLDTEGLLGKTHKNNQRTRMLLKILALSDVTIYRTKAERMHSDLFDFLRDARIAYQKFMLPALAEVTKSKGNSSEGDRLTAPHKRSSRDNGISSELLYEFAPSIIVFHETQHVKPFEDKEWREELTRRMGADCANDRVFNRIDYLSAGGQQKPGVTVDTRYENLRRAIATALDGQSDVRRPRKLSVFMHHLIQLNNRYGGEMKEIPKLTFPEQYFTCPMTCQVCSARCQKSLNHLDPHEPKIGEECKQSFSIDNKVYYCRVCSAHKKRSRAIWIPAPKNSSIVSAALSYMWNGSTLQCESCGPLLFSREEWFSPTNPEMSNKVDVKYDHIYDKDRGGRQDTCHTFQRVLDNFNVLSTHVSGVGEKITDMAKPDYWEPNDEITNCAVCQKDFAEIGLKKHHCRMCGKGVCDPCSKARIPVEERGYLEKVRVCNRCNSDRQNKPLQPSDGNVASRKAFEVTANTLGLLGKVVQIPAVLAKEYARPAYWQPDSECEKCICCSDNFASLGLSVHHCRRCGYGVCSTCSKNRALVPERGYLDYPVRVCKDCFKLLQPASS